jgi:hypothetical protein
MQFGHRRTGPGLAAIISSILLATSVVEPRAPATIQNTEPSGAHSTSLSVVAARSRLTPSRDLADLHTASGVRQAGTDPIGERWMSVGPSGSIHCGRVGVSPLFVVDVLDPCSGRVTALAVDPTDPSGNTLYLGAAQGGVWKTIDGGLTWASLLDRPSQPDGTPLTDYTMAVGSITVTAGGIVYVGTGESNSGGFQGAGILESSDGGLTWTQLGLDVLKQSRFYNVLVDPSDTMRIVAAADTGLWSSSDGGANWKEISGSIPTLAPGTRFTSLVLDPTNSSILYGAGGGSIFKSKDFGATWTLSRPASTVGCSHPASCTHISLAIAASSPSTVVAAIGDGTVWRTVDNGVMWSLVPSPPANVVPIPPTYLNLIKSFCEEVAGNQCDYDIVVAIDPTDPQIILLGGQDLWVTYDGGSRWRDFGGYLAFQDPGNGNVHSDQHAIVFSPADHQKIFVGNDGGIWTARWHTVDVGGHVFPWHGLNNGLSISQFYSVATDPQELSSFFGGTQDVGILDHDVASGVSHALSSTVWDDTNPGDGAWAAYDPSDPTTAYAGFNGWSGGACSGNLFQGGTCLLRRTGGLNCCYNLNGWFGVLQSQFSSLPVAAAIDPSSPSTIYIPDLATRNRLRKTSDRGDHWSNTGLDLSATCGGGVCLEQISAIAVAPSNSSFIYAGTTFGKFFVSTDGGISFHRRDSGSLPGYEITRIAVDSSDPNVAYATFMGTGTGHVWVSRQAAMLSSGPNWTDISSNLPDFPVNAIVLDAAGTGAIYVGSDIGVFVSLDSGGTWQAFGSGLPRVQVMDLEFSAGNVALMAATYGRSVWSISHLPTHPSTYVVTYTSGLGPNAESLEADCYPGDFATGGGFDVNGGAREPTASRPNVTRRGPTGWVTGFGVGVPGTGKVFADCMTPTAVGGGHLSSYAVEADRTLGPAAGRVNATCSGSDMASGGGFETGGLKVVRESEPNITTGSPTGWSAFFGVSIDLSVTVRAFAVCLSGPGFSTAVVSAAESLGGSAGGLSAQCPAREPAIGGGFSTVGGAAVPLTSRPDVPAGVATAWTAAFGPGGGTATAYVDCLGGATSASVSCTPSSVLDGAPTTCTAIVSDVDNSSSETPSGLVLFSAGRPGTFLPSSSCNLSGTGSSSSCNVRFTPGAGSVGAVAITAAYKGDVNHQGSTDAVLIDVFDFTLAATPSDQTVLRGAGGRFTVTSALVPGSAGAPASIGISVVGLPSDASFRPTALALPGAVQLTVQTGALSLGDFDLSLSGTVAGGARTTNVALHIYDFALTAMPRSLQALITGSNAYAVSAALVPGSSTIGLPTISLAVAGLPSGATGSFNPTSGTPTFSSALTITTANVASGTYKLTVTGTDGRSPEGGSRNVQPTLVILTAPQAIQLIIEHVNTLQSTEELNRGQANSLIVKLNHSIDSLNNRPDKDTACNQLSAFVHEVNALEAAGILTPSQANSLLSGPLGVLAIMAALSC